MPDSPSSLRARVLTAASAKPSPTRKQGRVAAAVLIAASVALGVTVFEGVGGFAHGSGRPLGVTIALATGWTVVSLVLTWLVVGRGGSTMARRPLLVGAAAVAMPFILFAWMHLFYGTYAEPFEAIGFRCLRYTLFISALPLAAFLVLRRAVEPRHPAALGAGAGAACAAWAGGLVDLWCPLTNSMHVLVGHVAPLVAATIVGAVAGRFMLGVRGLRSK
jgi:uncharacterized membrane protein YozB (DUF420 family)